MNNQCEHDFSLDEDIRGFSENRRWYKPVKCNKCNMQALAVYTCVGFVGYVTDNKKECIAIKPGTVNEEIFNAMDKYDGIVYQKIG